jgi:PAS domain-containing protein
MGSHQDGAGPVAAIRQWAEQVARKSAPLSPEDIEALSPHQIRQTLHDLRVYQIELEMQNEELRGARAEIAAAKDRYFDLYDAAPVGYCTVNEEGLILEANLTATTLLDEAKGALINQPISRFVLREDQDTYPVRPSKPMQPRYNKS